MSKGRSAIAGRSCVFDMLFPTLESRPAARIAGANGVGKPGPALCCVTAKISAFPNRVWERGGREKWEAQKHVPPRRDAEFASV